MFSQIRTIATGIVAGLALLFFAIFKRRTTQRDQAVRGMEREVRNRESLQASHEKASKIEGAKDEQVQKNTAASTERSVNSAPGDFTGSVDLGRLRNDGKG